MQIKLIGHTLRRNCLLKRTVERMKVIEVKGRQRRRRKYLQGHLKERRGYWKLKEETLHRTL
jgi:hypothetical protein